MSGQGLISTPIIESAKAGKSPLVRDLLNAGVDPNPRVEHDETGLTWAAQLGHTAVVKDFLAGGVDREARGNRFGATPILLAAKGGHRDVVAMQAVLADPDDQDEQGPTPIMRAIDKADPPTNPNAESSPSSRL